MSARLMAECLYVAQQFREQGHIEFDSGCAYNYGMRAGLLNPTAKEAQEMMRSLFSDALRQHKKTVKGIGPVRQYLCMKDGNRYLWRHIDDCDREFYTAAMRLRRKEMEDGAEQYKRDMKYINRNLKAQGLRVIGRISLDFGKAG